MSAERCPCCGRPMARTPSAVRVVAAEYPGLPCAEMLERGWLGDATTVRDADDLRNRVLGFFGVGTPDDLRGLLATEPKP